MKNSILNSIKKMLDIEEGCVHFDETIIAHINTALMILTQLGVGPEKGFLIKDPTSKWSDFIDDESKLEGVKSYIYLRVKPLFDPTSSSAISGAMKNVADELEWRLSVIAEELTSTKTNLPKKSIDDEDEYDKWYD